MIYCTRSEHTNHYTTDAVIFINENENLITRNFLNIALTNVLIYGKLARCRVQRNPLQIMSSIGKLKKFLILVTTDILNGGQGCKTQF
jgi:hypothetical protein